jgi:hypothetical protein
MSVSADVCASETKRRSAEVFGLCQFDDLKAANKRPK